jgi:predicted metal-dependent enzyme (double-stranded beta helix superfamily)
VKLFKFSPDGGPESTVKGFFFVEIKSLFSIVLLRFADGSRDAYHNHAFDAVSWVLKGQLEEIHYPVKEDAYPEYHTDDRYPSIWPVITLRSTMHKVVSHGNTYVLSFRGPWNKTWKEVVNGEELTLTNGRKVVG